MTTKLCKKCGVRKCMQGGFETCTVCFNEKIKSPDITWRKNYFPSKAPRKRKGPVMKQCIKLDMRIDLEDDTVKVSINSAYAPVHAPYLQALQSTARQLAREQFKELFDSDTKIRVVNEVDPIPMILFCAECRTSSDSFEGPNDARSHKEGCSRIGNDPRNDVWLENLYRLGTRPRPEG